MRTNRHFDHNIGNEGNRALNRVERTSMLGRKSLIAIELHAKANLVQAAIAQLCQARIVKKIAARVKAHVRMRVQLARRIEKRDCGGNPGPFRVRRFGLVKVSWTEK